MLGIMMILCTALLVVMGAFLYLGGFIGWGQFCFVMASGTAGGGIVLLVEKD